MNKCINCKYVDLTSKDYPCYVCEGNDRFEDWREKRTNYDKITSSVDALAEIMDNYRWCPYFLNSTCDSEIECLECIKEWLQKECDE
jgi:hypothetical protein